MKQLTSFFGRGLLVAVLTLTFSSGLVYHGSAMAKVDNGHASPTGQANASDNAGGGAGSDGRGSGGGNAGGDNGNKGGGNDHGGGGGPGGGSANY